MAHCSLRPISVPSMPSAQEASLATRRANLMSMLWLRCFLRLNQMLMSSFSNWLMIFWPTTRQELQAGPSRKGVQGAKHACVHAQEAFLAASGWPKAFRTPWLQRLWCGEQLLAKSRVGPLRAKPLTWYRSLVWRTTKRQWLAVRGLLGTSTKQCSLCAVCLPVCATPLCTWSCMECGNVSDAGFLLLPAATYVAATAALHYVQADDKPFNQT